MAQDRTSDRPVAEVVGAINAQAQPVAASEPKEPLDMDDAIGKLTQQMAQLTEIVLVQKRTMDALQENELRESDARAIRDETLEVHARMGRSGWMCKLTGTWTQAHINQLRIAMRKQMQMDGTNTAKARNRATLKHRKTGEYAEFDQETG